MMRESAADHMIGQTPFNRIDADQPFLHDCAAREGHGPHTVGQFACRQHPRKGAIRAAEIADQPPGCVRVRHRQMLDDRGHSSSLHIRNDARKTDSFEHVKRTIHRHEN